MRTFSLKDGDRQTDASGSVATRTDAGARSAGARLPRLGRDFGRISVHAPIKVKGLADQDEREADRVAGDVMRMPEPGAEVRQPARQPLNKPADAGGSGGTVAPPLVHEVLRSRGEPLDEGTRAFMEPRFGCDFSRVRIHRGDEGADSAKAIGARAYTVGSDIVWGAGRYAPGTAPGRHLMAHELAHVVQQAESPGPVVQRFTEPGHKLLGERAFGTELLDLGGVRMTFGDSVAMGDYFGSFERMRDLAATPGKGPATRGVVLYVLWVKIRKHSEETKLRDVHHEDPEFISAELAKNKDARIRDLYTPDAARVADQLSRSLDSKNISHFPNPLAGDTALTLSQKNQRTVGEGDDKHPLGAAATYRDAHEKAMEMAYRNGTHYRDPKFPQNNDDALLADAFASHFLTDSFSASHLRTPRQSIKEYWDKKVPGFRNKLIQWLADQINRQPLRTPVGDKLGRAAAPLVAGSSVRTAAVSQLSLLFSGGDFSFGDVVSLIIHDAEGAREVEATIDGKRVTLVGDKGLVDSDADPMNPKGDKEYSLKPEGAARQTADAAVAAVQASIEDIQNAYDAGLPENLLAPGVYMPAPMYGDLRRTFHHKEFETFKKEALGKRGLYKAETLVPEAVDDKLLPPDKRSLPWMQKSADELLADTNKVIGAALVSFGESAATEFEERLKDMKDLRPEHKEAIKKALIEPLASGDAGRIRNVLKAILAESK